MEIKDPKVEIRDEISNVGMDMYKMACNDIYNSFNTVINMYEDNDIHLIATSDLRILINKIKM